MKTLLELAQERPDVKPAPLSKAAKAVIILLLVLGAIFALLVNASATEWKTYRDDTAGYSITYPSFLRLARPPEGGRKWMSYARAIMLKGNNVIRTSADCAEIALINR
jgi:hypothetical protein